MKAFFTLLLIFFGTGIFAQEWISDGNCKAYFSYEVNDKLMMPYAATAINFYDLSVGKVKEWYWDFGEGNTSREQNPMFIFKHPAPSPDVKINPYRTVSLTILTDSCKSYYSLMINILDGKPYQKPDCTAGFKYYIASQDTLTGTVKVQFTNLSEGDSLQYLWQFGDGRTATEREPLVIFDRKPEKRAVCLTVKGKNNCSETFCDTIHLVTTIDPKPEECYVYFGYAVNTKIQTFAPALVLDFYGKTPVEAAEWKWDFGDGTTSNDPNPTHIFNFPLGKDSLSRDSLRYRKVTLTISTKTGCIASWSDVIDIYMNTSPPDPAENCHAWFKFYRPADIITIPEVVPFQFRDASEGKVTQWLWRFENGDSSTVQSPLVTFSIFKATQKVCLTIFTADNCSSTWCETVIVTVNKVDTVPVTYPVCPYVMRIRSGFPVQLSSCAGWAEAQVYLKDSLVKATDYKWSTGTEGQAVKNLCPTVSYTVKARTPDGCVVASTFILNSDGTIREIPATWWVNGSIDGQNIQVNLNGKNLTAEWKLPDGTVIRSDSIPVGSLNGSNESLDLIVRDSTGNIIYTEKIALMAYLTGSVTNQLEQEVRLYPNPVRDILHLSWTGRPVEHFEVNIYDLSGRVVAASAFSHIISGQAMELDVSALKGGIYVCRMILDNKDLIINKFTK